MKNEARMGARSMMIAGIVLVIFGLLLLASPAAAGSAVVMVVAFVMVLTGIAQAVQAFRSAGLVNRIISVMLGVVVAGLGVMVWLNPEIGSGFLTVLLMFFFITHGLWKVATAWRFHGSSGWIWLLLSGLISLVFVYLLWKQWPLSGAWAIGVLIGLDLLLTGIAMIVVALAARRVRSSGYLDTINL